MWLLWFRKEKAELAKKKILTREFLSHSPSHAVRVFYLFNSVIECCPRAWKQQNAAALDVFTARGSWDVINLFFPPFFLLAAKEQHYHAEGFPLLPALFSPAPRCMSSALPFGDEPSSHVSHPAPGGVFPLIHIERSFDVKLLCFLILK